MCIYRGIKIGALNIECIINGRTSHKIHIELYHMFFNELTMCRDISGV